MALAYTISGGSAGTSNQLSAKVWNKTLHEQVQNKRFFKNMIGKDKGGEGSEGTTNSPIVEKTDLRKQPGDQITVGLVRQLVTGGPAGSSSYNAGVVGSAQLVDNESTMVWHNVKVKIAHRRLGVRVEDFFGYQKRSPYDLKMTARDMLSAAVASLDDDDVFFAAYCGYSSAVIREQGEAVAVPLTHPNVIYGKDRSAFTGLTTNDTFGADVATRIAQFASEQNITPINGGKHILVVSPRDWYHAMTDSTFVDGLKSADVRGDENRIFTGSLGDWAGLSLMRSNKVAQSAVNWDGITASGGDLTVANETTLPGGIGATQISMPILLGANAIALGSGVENYMERRKEDDYGNLVGFAAGSVQGFRRADFALAADSGTDGTVKNQSSAVIYLYATGGVSNASAIWS